MLNWLKYTSRRQIVDARFFKWTAPKGYKQAVPKAEDEIIVSMSSGVDSSVCALMMKSRYKNVRGIFMSNWSEDKFVNSNSKCSIDEDWNQVQEICQQIDIPCERVNFEKEYWNQVFEPMLHSYERGLTPNPDINCNRYVKFGKMMEYLTNYYRNKTEKWWLVTGHYARVLQKESSGEFNLFRGAYKPKDQSYYLTTVSKDVLSRVLMPIGHYTKPEVRSIAKDYGLASSTKPDSQGLCFVSQSGKFNQFLDDYIEPKPGNIVTRDGKVWGKHNGIWQATIGQKSGVSMPQGDPNFKGVWLICDKNIERNELIIARKDDRAAFFKDMILVDTKSWHWMTNLVTFEQLKDMPNLNCQIRSLQTPNQVTSCSVDTVNHRIVVKIDHEISGIAPGQTLALYNEHDQLLGSGLIAGSQ